MDVAIITIVKTLAAGKFKNVCLKTLDQVAQQRTAVVITKRGRPVAKLVPIEDSAVRTLKGSVIEETGDPFSTGEAWNDAP